MAVGRRLALCALAVLCGIAGNPILAQQQPRRLSAWLLEHSQPDSYPTGLSWLVPGEEPAQHLLKHELLQELAVQPGLRRLHTWVALLPITGRVPVVFADARWLMAHPDRDPVLLPGHSVLLPRRPRTITVISDDGDRCAVTHASGREATAYVEACSVSPSPRADWVWIVQPDGRVQRFGVAAWNRETQDEPAPGAWIWAPRREHGYPDRLSDRLVHFLATQGPAPDPDAGAIALPPATALAFSLRSRSAAYYANDWGETGLLQTPSARIPRTGTLTVNFSHVWPYTRGNVFVSPFDWLEAGFRYSGIANQLYGPAELSGTQSYKDKSFDAKFRIWQESAYVPEIAMGFRDIAGTGLFSGEYVAGSKRFGAFDLSLGLGWGYVGGRGNVRNPLGVLSRRFDTRRTDPGQGGSFSLSSYFHGPTALFGGLQYQTPWEPLVLRIEREGNDYQHEPQQNNLPQRTPWNFGLTYRLGRSTHLSAGVERGNRLMLGIAFSGRLDEAYTPKVSDPPRVPYSLRPAKPPQWHATAAELSRQTGWRVGRIEQAKRDLRVTVLDAETTYWAERADRAAAVLNRDAPAEIDRFVFVYRQRGIEMAEHVVDRDTWAAEQTRPVPPHERLDTIIARAPEPLPQAAEVLRQARPRLEHGIGPELQYTLGGPDAFALYQFGLAERAAFWIRDDTWLRAKFRLGLFNNYDRYKYTAPSDLPRVRTFLREYQTTSRLTMNHLQATHAGRLTDKQYYSIYGGYLEEMFGGVGTEWLYRPFAGRTAVGVDLNYVRQRDFEQDFGFRDYRVATGHATFYLDTGWNDVLATLSAGRYLAGDVGATLQLSRVFRNGVTVGAFATQTTARSKFGEGSFDKGVFLTIPFDTLVTRSTSAVARITWKPLTRDGGAKLSRQDPLYTITSARDHRTLWYRPAEKSDQFSITPAQPYLRAAARPSDAAWSNNPGYEHQLVQALHTQGFENIAVGYEPTGRLEVRLAHAQLRPIERAIGRAARTALQGAPLEAREIQIRFFEEASPIATYQFLDLARLDRFFNGAIGAEQLEEHVAAYYADASSRAPNALQLLRDIRADDQPSTFSSALRDSRPIKAIARASRDSVVAAKSAREIDWGRAALIGGGVVLASSRLDNRFFDFAQDHDSSRWLKGATSLGNAIPWLGMAGAGILALDASNPVRQRTAFAAGEAGLAAFAASTALKVAFGRARPESGEGNGSFHGFSTEDAHNSFPSRHAAVAWAVATPFAAEYGSYWPYALAAVTTFGRTASREHWFSDSVAGSVLGYGLGRLFWQSGAERHRDAPRLMLGPQGLAMKWDLH